jgi:hypothetical protein
MHAFSRSLLSAGLILSAAAPLRAGVPDVAPQVQVVRAAGWSQGDAVREGAAEFMVLLELARLTRDPAQGGLVGVGDRRGFFGTGAEQAMHRAVLRGVPVVKLAPSGRVRPAPHGLFIDGTGLSEEEACALLARCRQQHGALPVVGEGATDTDLARLRARLQSYQQEFTLAAATRLAAR